VRAALKNCGYDIPPTDITINLAPADIRKEGSGFDLPMALGILGAYGGLNKKEVPDCLFVGELWLDGGIRGVRGALPIAIEARGKKIPRLIVPELNAREAAMVGGVEVYPVSLETCGDNEAGHCLQAWQDRGGRRLPVDAAGCRGRSHCAGPRRGLSASNRCGDA